MKNVINFKQIPAVFVFFIAVSLTLIKGDIYNWRGKMATDASSTPMNDQSRQPPIEQIRVLVEPEITVVQVAEPLPLRRYFTDALILTTMAAGLELVGRLHGPHKRGFFCDDQSIRYPLKSNTVNLIGLIIYSLIVNFIIIFIVEAYRLQKPELADEFYSRYEHGRTRVGRLIVRVGIFFGYSTACVLIIWSLTTATKYPIGRLRPHFIDVCRPDVGYNSCNTTSYITDYNCTTEYTFLIQEARLSFFSGHSSIALATATFFCFYTQDRLAGQLKSRAIVPALQTLQVSAAMFIAYTRVLDQWHHWSDVVVGCAVGVIVTSALCIYFIGLVPKIQPVVMDERTHLLPQNSKSQILNCGTCKRQMYQPPASVGTTF